MSNEGVRQMPLFEFRCKKCGKKFEELVMSATKDEKLNCPHCGSTRVEKLISTFAAGATYGDKGGTDSSCAPSRGGG